MATDRNQSQSQGTRKSSPAAGRHAGDDDTQPGEELRGTTDEGVEISASLDDEEDGLSADAEDDGDSLADDGADTDQGGARSSRGRRSGSGNFANDPERASEAGRKGGRN